MVVVLAVGWEGVEGLLAFRSQENLLVGLEVPEVGRFAATAAAGMVVVVMRVPGGGRVRVWVGMAIVSSVSCCSSSSSSSSSVWSVWSFVGDGGATPTATGAEDPLNQSMKILVPRSFAWPACASASEVAVVAALREGMKLARDFVGEWNDVLEVCCSDDVALVTSGLQFSKNVSVKDLWWLRVAEL